MSWAGTNGFDDLRNRVTDAQETLPKRLAQAASFVLAHPEDVALGTAASISKAAEVQPSTLVRLARHLGYDGFSDLQMVFRERLKTRSTSYEERLDRLERGGESGTGEAAILDGFIQAARQSVDRLASTIDHDSFARAVHILAGARTIYLVARRRSYPLTSHMAYAFGKLGIRAQMVNSPNGIDDEAVELATRDDAAIVCSFAPYAPEAITHANRMAELGVPVIAITDSAMSPLCKAATVLIEASESDFSGFRSISASMAIVSALPVAAAEKRRQLK